MDRRSFVIGMAGGLGAAPSEAGSAVAAESLPRRSPESLFGDAPGAMPAAESTLWFGALAELRSAPVPYAGDRIVAVVTMGYAEPGDGGGGLYRYAAKQAPGPARVMSADGAWWELVPEDGYYHGRQFGAVHDGETDDSAAYQRAVNAAEQTTSYGCRAVYVDAGVTVWKRGVVAEKSGNHIRISGVGKRGSVIRAGARVGTLIRIGRSDGVFSRIEVDHLAFDCSYLADCALDMTYCRFSSVHDCGFVKPPPLGVMLKIGRWVNRVYVNEFNGLGVDDRPTGMPWLIPGDTVNDLVAWGNAFSNFLEPVTCRSNAHDVKFFANTFDHVVKAGLAFLNGGRNVHVLNNFFEACGSRSEGLEIDARSWGTRTVSASIVAARVDASHKTALENLVIEGNEFANCLADQLGIFSGVLGLTWQRNHALRQYSYPYCVSFVEYAVGHSTQSITRILIDQEDSTEQFGELVRLGGPDAETDHNGMQIIWRKPPVRQLVHALYDLIPPDLTRWRVRAGAVAPSGDYETHPVYRLTNNAELSFEIDIQPISSWAGRYIRVVFLNRGTAEIANGAALIVLAEVDAGATELASSSHTARGDWVPGGRNMTLRIPPDARKVRFRLQQIDARDDAFVTAFHVDAASTDLRW